MLEEGAAVVPLGGWVQGLQKQNAFYVIDENECSTEHVAGETAQAAKGSVLVPDGSCGAWAERKSQRTAGNRGFS
jgi:hypothetical protein